LGDLVVDRRELRGLEDPDDGGDGTHDTTSVATTVEATPVLATTKPRSMDWSYQQNPASMADFRQCGAQPVSDGRDTPALLARDSQGTPRWFRACGQVYPLEQRAPNASGTYCTSWTRPSS
jgi:hypothetical protein